jgi:four helix bundle protein
VKGETSEVNRECETLIKKLYPLKLRIMLLNLKHKQLVVYKEIRSLIKEAYLITKALPEEEKFNMVSQIRRAALSVKLNLAEGASRKSAVERNRFYEISRSSLVEIDAAIETAVDLSYINEDSLEKLGAQLNKCFAMLSNMINK